MVEKMVLTTLLSVLLVSNTRVTQSLTTTPTTADEQPRFTAEYNPKIYVECGISQDNVVYLDTFNDSTATFNVSSNTAEDTSYSNNMSCRIQFRTGADPVFIQVFIEEFDLEAGSFCHFDYVCIKAAILCGRAFHPIQLNYNVPSHKTFTMAFHTDYSVTVSGFSFIFEITKLTSYVQSYEPYGIFIDPAETFRPVNMSDYEDQCSINNAYSHVNFVPFRDFDDPHTTGSNTTTTDSPYGGDERFIQCSEGNSERIFYLDSNNSYAFSSTNFFGIGYYSDNTSCKVKFVTSSMRQRLHVYYSAFNLEEASNCRFDSLCVNGVKYCSSWLRGRHFLYHIPANSSFTFAFTTDSSVVRTGFQANLIFDDALPSSGSYEATRGDGSYPNGVLYSYTDYTSYQDRCASGNSTTPTYY